MLSFAPQLASIYDAFAEPVTINGSATRGVAEDGFVDPNSLSVASTQPTLRVIAADNQSVAHGQTVVWNSATYKIAGLQPIAPDKLETRLILERQ